MEVRGGSGRFQKLGNGEMELAHRLAIGPDTGVTTESATISAVLGAAFPALRNPAAPCGPGRARRDATAESHYRPPEIRPFPDRDTCTGVAVQAPSIALGSAGALGICGVANPGAPWSPKAPFAVVLLQFARGAVTHSPATRLAERAPLGYLCPPGTGAYGPPFPAGEARSRMHPRGDDPGEVADEVGTSRQRPGSRARR
jgi:hypothetical protein